MKKSLLALAVLGAFAGVASAQTSIVIYGSFDGGIRNVDNVNPAGDNRTTIGSNGTFNSNRIGFKGVEDLGGGMNAHFVLETGFNTGTGALNNANNQLFERTAAVGLGGAWGSLDIGRQYTVAFKTIGAYDPFSYKYPGIALAVPATAGVRYNNDIQYTGTFSGVTIRAEHALGEVAGNYQAGSASAVGAGYAAGPFSIGGAYTVREVNLTPTAPVGNYFDNTHYTVGGAFKFGAGRVSAGYANEKQETTSVDTKQKFAWVGVNYNITPQVELTGAFYNQKLTALNVNGKKDLYMLAATYALSKRTNLYADIDYARFSGNGPIRNALGSQSRQTGVSLGVNHLF